MPDFPTAVPDIPDADVAETLFTMHDGIGHVPATNRILTNLRALATKLGIANGTGPPTTNALLRRTADGQSGWGKGVPSDLTGGGAGDANTVLRTTNGTDLLFGKLATPDLDLSTRMALAAQNPIINGGFEIWQRGASFTAVPTATYLADRWIYNKASSAVVRTAGQVAPPAAAALVPYSGATALQLAVTTPDSSLLSNEYEYLSQPIEGYVFAPFWQQPFTVGFWARATGTGVTGTYTLGARNGGADRCCVMEYQIGQANVWEYKTLTFPAAPSAGAWNLTNGTGLSLSWTLLNGNAGLTTTPGAWQTGGAITTANQINNANTTGNTFALWGVTIGLGATVAPYWPRLYAEQLQLCQRYLYVAGNTGAVSTVAYGHRQTATSSLLYLPVPGSMRAAPSLSSNISTNAAAPPTGTQMATLLVGAGGGYGGGALSSLALYGVAPIGFVGMQFTFGTAQAGAVEEPMLLQLGPQAMVRAEAEL